MVPGGSGSQSPQIGSSLLIDAEQVAKAAAEKSQSPQIGSSLLIVIAVFLKNFLRSLNPLKSGLLF